MKEGLSNLIKGTGKIPATILSVTTVLGVMALAYSIRPDRIGLVIGLILGLLAMVAIDGNITKFFYSAAFGDHPMFAKWYTYFFGVVFIAVSCTLSLGVSEAIVIVERLRLLGEMVEQKEESEKTALQIAKEKAETTKTIISAREKLALDKAAELAQSNRSLDAKKAALGTRAQREAYNNNRAWMLQSTNPDNRKYVQALKDIERQREQRKEEINRKYNELTGAYTIGTDTQTGQDTTISPAALFDAKMAALLTAKKGFVITDVVLGLWYLLSLVIYIVTAKKEKAKPSRRDFVTLPGILTTYFGNLYTKFLYRLEDKLKIDLDGDNIVGKPQPGNGQSRGEYPFPPRQFGRSPLDGGNE